MIKHKAVEFINLLSKLEDKDYLFSLIAYGAAPAIREEKPSYLMTFTKSSRNLYELWHLYKKDVCEKLDIDFSEVRETRVSIQVLFFKRKHLQEHINSPESKCFLHKMGYDLNMTLNECIMKLKNNFQYGCPHEVGVFLGIPPEDIEGFIKNKGKNCLLCSYWKVYCNPGRAIALFSTYDNARIYMRQIIEKSLQLNSNEKSLCL